MAECRRLGPQRPVELDLGPRVGHVIRAPDDMADGEGDIVHHRGEGVEIAAVGADQHGIALARLVDVLGPAHQIAPGAAPAGELEAPIGLPALGLQLGLLGRRQSERGTVIDRRRAALELQLALEGELLRRLVAGIEPAARLQPLRGLVVAVQAIGLARQLVPGEAQPAEIRLDARGEFGRRALAIRIVEAQQEPAARRAGMEPVGERDIGIADMEAAGGAGAKRTRQRSI